MSINTKELAGLLVIADKAIEAHDADRAISRAADELRDTTNGIKDAMGITERLPDDHPDWVHVQHATAHQLEQLGHATRRAYNAKRRLATAIRAHRRSGGAQ